MVAWREIGDRLRRWAAGLPFSTPLPSREVAVHPALAPLRRRVSVALLCLAVVADGYDAAALALAIPSIGADWHIAASSFTVALVATNLGAVAGFVGSGWLSARWGRNAVVWRSVLLFSLATIATGTSDSMPALAAARCVAGVGFGAVLPAAVALAADLGSERRREITGTLMIVGVTAGTMLAGLTGGALIAGPGWRAVFVLPGSIVLGLALALWWQLPALADAGVDPLHRAAVGRLFARRVRSSTAMLWCVAFLVFAAFYLLQAWLPTLLVEYGFARDRAPISLAAMGFGGLIGGVVIVVAATRLGMPRAVVAVLVVAVLSLVSVGVLRLTDGALLVALAGAGGGLVAGAAGMTALAIRVYSGSLRTTGIGWTAALGRIGSVAGPACGGVLVARALAPQLIVSMAAAPVLVAVVIAGVLAGRLGVDDELSRTQSPAAGDTAGEPDHA